MQQLVVLLPQHDLVRRVVAPRGSVRSSAGSLPGQANSHYRASSSNADDLGHARTLALAWLLRRRFHEERGKIDRSHRSTARELEKHLLAAQNQSVAVLRSILAPEADLYTILEGS